MNQDFNPQEEMKHALSLKEFPQEKIEDAFRIHYFEALKFVSPMQLGCDSKTFTELSTTPISNINFFRISFAINALMNVNASQLDISLTEYAFVQEQIEKMSVYWNEVVKPIEEEVSIKYKNKLALQRNLGVKQANKMVNPNLRTN
ncbi:hypothetical protein [Empedobacter falsenii]|uniref:hypothetical protein n=1 Tax=Empedobacter falsenii TaxID=343874 RepID=UPI003A80C1A2